MVGITPQEFVARWAEVTLTEKASSQSHFIDLCHLLDQPTPTEEDPTGDRYTFEKGAEKTPGLTSGRRGMMSRPNGLTREENIAWLRNVIEQARDHIAGA